MKDGKLKSCSLSILRIIQAVLYKLYFRGEFFLLKKGVKKLRLVQHISFSKKDKVLILVPHADDELINCHSLISKYKENILLFFCSLTGTKTDFANKTRRETEFTRYCNTANVDYYIACSDQNLYDEMSNTIKNFKPTRIVLPSCIDWHDEHQLLSILLYRFLCDNNIEELSEIIVYSVSFPMHQDFVNLVCPMTSQEQRYKWSLFDSIYESQKGFPTYRFKNWERLYAFELDNSYAIEYFHSFSLDEWLVWYEVNRNVYIPTNVIKSMRETNKLSYKLYVDCDGNK